MNIQVMRFETKAKLGAQVQLVKHVDGTTRPETATKADVVAARDRAFGSDLELGAVAHLDGEGMAEARIALDAALASRPKRGRPPKQCVDFLFAGPPPYGDSDAWSPDREVAWADEIRDALRELVGPNSKIVTVDLHRDETSPHVQGTVVPIDSKGRLGWCHVRDEAAKRLRPEVERMRAAAEQRIGERRAAGEVVLDLPPPSTKSRYGVLQDWLYFRVSRRFGLERGEVGSQAKHQAIDRAAAVERRAEAAERRAEQARQAAGESDFEIARARRSAVDELKAARQAAELRAAELDKREREIGDAARTRIRAFIEKSRREAAAAEGRRDTAERAALDAARSARLPDVLQEVVVVADLLGSPLHEQLLGAFRECAEQLSTRPLFAFAASLRARPHAREEPVRRRDGRDGVGSE